MLQLSNPNDRRSNPIKYKRRNILKTTGGVFALSGLAGCVGGTGDGATSTSGAMTPEKPDSITVKSFGGIWKDTMDEAVTSDFTEDTGIEVEYDTTERKVAQSKVKNAIEQDREPPYNVVWSTQPSSHQSYRLELTEGLNPEILTNRDELFDQAFPDIDTDRPPYVNLYSYTYTLCYNEDQVEEKSGDNQPIETWETLWDSKYEKSVSTYGNGFGFHPVLGKITNTPLDAGEGNYGPMWERLREFAPNIGMVADDTNQTEALRSGEITYGVLLANNLIPAKREKDEPVDWTVPKEGCTAWSDSLWIPRNQPESNLYWSQVWVNYALDADNQKEFGNPRGMPMMNKNVENLDYMKEDPAFPTSDEDWAKLITIDPNVHAEYSSIWYEKFNEIIG